MCVFLFLQSQLYNNVTAAFIIVYKLLLRTKLTFLHICAGQFHRRVKSLNLAPNDDYYAGLSLIVLII
jgi:hypothetical protein